MGRFAVSVFLLFSFSAISFAEGQKTSITIDEGISRVLKDSRLLKIEIAGADMSFEDTLLALSKLLPHISASINKTYNQYTPEMLTGLSRMPTGEKEPLAYGIDVYQTLFDFGKSISSYKASTEVLKARKANIETVKRTVTLDFIFSYFDLLEAEKMISVAEREIESLTSYLKDMNSLFDEGVIVKNDLLAAKVRLADARQKLTVSRSLRELAAARLNTVLTLPLSGDITASEVELDIPELPAMEDAFRSAQNQRPEISFFEGEIRASIARERAYAAGNLPAIFADGGYRYGENRHMAHEDNAYIQLGAKMDLYDGGVTGALVMKERKDLERLKEQKVKLVEDIKYEVKSSILALNDAREKLDVANEAFAQSEENVRFYRIKFNNGVATSTDVLEAITLETRAETNYYTADYELKRSYAKLLYSMGKDMTTIYKKTEK
ncbi:MAG: TolC family protein [Candidatus Omnitrophica bacterium]|nr:TolC family protein [Candidatus Omnitrophota bacterium]